MDGQRRFTRSLRVMRRRFGARLLAVKLTRPTRIIARSGAVALLLTAVGYGLLAGGHLDPKPGSKFGPADAIASRTGFAADDVEISGLTFHAPEDVLKAIGVRPGASLFGFDAKIARTKLEKRSWVASATIQRVYPNTLKISLIERVPFAVWRMKEGYAVIDRSGVAMTEVDFSRMKHLPLVTGDGANTEAAILIDALTQVPDLLIKVRGSARVGGRRWTLYLDNGVKVLLPETGIERALTLISQLDASQRVLAKAIESVDLRLSGQVVFTALPGAIEQAALARNEIKEN